MKKNSLSVKQVQKIASLANLALTHSEAEKIQKQLLESLDYIEILNSLDTNKIRPTNQVTGKENVTREDVVSPSLTQNKVLDQAGRKQNGYFKIKNIFE